MTTDHSHMLPPSDQNSCQFSQTSRNEKQRNQGENTMTTINQSATQPDVAALLKHLQIEQADVFGVSLGGTVAVMMAVRHPDLIGRVATYGAAFSNFRARVGLSADDDIVQFQRESYEKVAPDPTQSPTL